MQHDEDLVQHPTCHFAGFLCWRAGRIALKHRLDQFQIPVAEPVPHKVIDGVGRRIETQIGHRLVQFGKAFHHFTDDPCVDRQRGRRRGNVAGRSDPVGLAEPRGIPQLGGEVAIAFDPLLIHLHIAALAFHRRHEEAQRVSAIFVDQAQRIDDIALGLGHLCAICGADQPMEIESGPWVLTRHRLPHHHHARIPEEQDVKT